MPIPARRASARGNYVGIRLSGKRESPRPGSSMMLLTRVVRSERATVCDFTG